MALSVLIWKEASLVFTEKYGQCGAVGHGRDHQGSMAKTVKDLLGHLVT
jgi:hypothetical protein